MTARYFGPMQWRTEASFGSQASGEASSQATSLADLRSVNCLLLLGGAGSGKTTDLLREHKALRESGVSTIFVALRTVREAGDLEGQIENSGPFNAWQVASDARLHLFLDGIDEAGVEVRRLAAEIVQFARRHASSSNPNRLALRITSRPSALPPVLREGLKELYAESGLEIRHILPLTAPQILSALPSTTAPSWLFSDNGVHALLATPLALQLITDPVVWNRLPRAMVSARRTLFELATPLLLSEPNDHRRDEVSSDVAMAIAGRVAVLLLVSNRTNIRLARKTKDNASSALELHEVAGTYPEVDRGNERPVTPDDVQQVLTRPMFEPTGDDLVAFRHRGLVEYLAAKYLTLRGTPSQCRDLLSSENAIIPQLYDLAGWLLAIDRDFFDLLLTDPRVPTTLYLNCDLADLDPPRRTALVRRLLEFSGTPEARSTPWRMYYDSLPHWRYRECADEAAAALADTTRSPDVHEAAAWLVEMTGAAELVPELLAFARNAGAGLFARAQAVHAIAALGAPEQRAALYPLAAKEMTEDRDDEIKGQLLWALWPPKGGAAHRAVDTSKMLSCLTARKHRSLLGSYWSFLHHLPEQVGEADWLPVLRWLVTRLRQRRASGAWREHQWDFDRLLTATFAAAMAGIGDAEVRRGLADVVVERIRAYESPIPEGDDEAEKVSLTDEARHLLLESIVDGWSASDDRVHELALSLIRGDGVRLLSIEDWPFVVARAARPSANRNWLLLVEGLCRFGGFTKFPSDTGIRAVDECLSVIRSAYARDTQESARPAEVVRKTPARASTKTSTLSPSAARDRIVEMLDRCEAGQTDAWWHLNFHLTDKGDGLVRFDHDLDLRGSPGWSAADATTRLRIADAARAFLNAEDRLSDSWLDGKTLPYPVAAGLRAWFLLLDERVPLPDEVGVWTRWINVMVRWPFGSNGQRIVERFHDLIMEAARRNQAAVQRALRAAIDEGPVTWDLYLGRYRGLWTDDLASHALDACSQPKSIEARTGVLSAARVSNVASTLVGECPEVVLRWLALDTQADRPGWPAVLAGVLTTRLERQAWSQFGPTLLNDSEKFRAVIECLCEGSAFGQDILNDLDEAEQGEVLQRLDRMYPRVEDPEHRASGAHVVTTQESVRDFRDALLQRLRSKGTRRAYEALKRFEETSTDRDFAARVVAEAHSRMLREVWQPLPPNVVLSRLGGMKRRDA